MPYIKKEDRVELYKGQRVARNAGELNFVVTTICMKYLDGHGCEELSYAKINEVVGALECAKLELYRRAAAPYEDEKRKENGDVY